MRLCILLACALCGVLRFACAAQDSISQLSGLREVVGLIRSNLTDVTAAELDQSALEGVLSRLKGRVLLTTNVPAAAEPTEARVDRIRATNTFEDRFAYIRIGAIDAAVSQSFVTALDRQRLSNRIEGLIVDLRFAGGNDFTEAGRLADVFLDDERLLLRLGTETVRSTSKTNAFTRPVAVLVNRETTGAAEVLAGILREAGIGLLIGGSTAGRASLFQEFTLSNGQRLLLAVSQIELASGQRMPLSGLAPDITVAVSADEEKLHLADPYRSTAVAGDSRAEAGKAGGGTNRAIRLNEAELVRLRREGIPLADGDIAPGILGSHAPADKPVTDPALARALDLLKGLALVHGDRSATRHGSK